LLVVQLVRLKYITSEFTRQSFEDAHKLMEQYLPGSLFSILEKWIKPRLLSYVNVLPAGS
jgi:hypothetical protein